ncbi:MAG: hypothetical protein GY851_00780, partial [bacterium]|nr:hypothetical protein [bacterium]
DVTFEVLGYYSGGVFINVAPTFTDAYHLASDSVCVDVGESVAGLPSTDLDGDARVVGAAVDIGADEFSTGGGSGGGACVARYRHEAAGLQLDSQGDNDLTNNGVSLRTYGEMEGDSCGKYSHTEGDYQVRTDVSLSADFPGKSGTSNGSFTICGWFRSGWLWSNGNMEVVKKYNAGADQRSFSLRANCVSGVRKFQLVIGHTSGTLEEAYLHASPIGTGVWYHVGASWDNDTKACRIRVYDATAGAILGTDLTDTGSNEMSPTSAD